MTAGIPNLSNGKTMKRRSRESESGTLNISPEGSGLPRSHLKSCDSSMGSRAEPTRGYTMVRMISEVESIWGRLGGEAVFGRPLRDDSDLQQAIRDGFPQGVVAGLIHSANLNLKEIAATLDLTTRALQRRPPEGRLARSESDLIYRLARIVVLANEYLGDEQLAHRWLRAPNAALGGRSPLDLVDTEPGTRMVENVLGRIAYGGVS